MIFVSLECVGCCQTSGWAKGLAENNARTMTGTVEKPMAVTTLDGLVVNLFGAIGAVHGGIPSISRVRGTAESEIPA